jgi:hypothetical protein
MRFQMCLLSVLVASVAWVPALSLATSCPETELVQAARNLDLVGTVLIEELNEENQVQDAYEEQTEIAKPDAQEYIYSTAAENGFEVLSEIWQTDEVGVTIVRKTETCEISHLMLDDTMEMLQKVVKIEGNSITFESEGSPEPWLPKYFRWTKQ